MLLLLFATAIMFYIPSSVVCTSALYLVLHDSTTVGAVVHGWEVHFTNTGELRLLAHPRQMESLPDEILLQILTKLPTVDAIRLESVSDRWRRLCAYFWMQQTEIAVSLSQLSWASVATRLSLAGSRLLSVHLFTDQTQSLEDSQLLSAQDVHLLASNCPLVSELSFCGLRLTNELIIALGSAFPKLRSLRLDYFLSRHLHYHQTPALPDFDAAISSVVQSCTELRELYLHLDRIPESRPLHALANRKLESLTLITRFYQAEFFEDLFRWVAQIGPNLRCLELVMCFDHYVSHWWEKEDLQRFLSLIWARAPNLRQIRMDFREYYRREEFPLWKFVSSLQNFPCNLIEHLDLQSCPGLETVDLSVAANFCPNLSRLNLSDCKLGMQSSLAALATCQKLSHIDVSRVQFYDRQCLDYKYLNDASFCPLLNIFTLRCIVADGSQGISEYFLQNEMLEFVLENRQLTVISFKHTPALTETVLKAFYESIHGLGDFSRSLEHMHEKSVLRVKFSPLSDNGTQMQHRFVELAYGNALEPLCGLWHEGHPESCSLLIARNAIWKMA